MKHLLTTLFVLFMIGGAYAQRYSGSSDLVPVSDKQEKSDYLAASTEKTLLADAKSTEASPANSRPWYLIVDLFKKRSDAEGYINTLNEKGVDAEIKQLEDGGVYYVHIPKYKTNKITYEKLVELRKEFHHAWFQHLD